MDETQFAQICRALGSGRTRRGAMGTLAALIGAGFPLASTLEAGAEDRKNNNRNRNKNKRKNKDKIPVCHCPAGKPGKCKTLWLLPPEVRDHLKHGDTVGQCGGELTQPPAVAGMCTPLLQICWPEWLGGNRCCDINAECVYVNADVPAFFCLDKNKNECSNDIECRSRFTDPNITCMKRFPATCREGVRQCCQRRTCDVDNHCAGEPACCNSGATLLQSVCCAPGQICDPAFGCRTN